MKVLFVDKKEHFPYKYERFAGLYVLFADKKERFPYKYEQSTDMKHQNLGQKI